MQRVKAVVPIFLILLFFSFFILLFFQNPLSEALQIFTLPVQRWAFMMSQQAPTMLTPQQQLQQENNDLQAQLTKMQEIQKDNQALHDQFQTTAPAPQKLLPAEIIGSYQTSLLIDKGEQDKVHSGEVVVYKDNLIGKITKTTPHISLVTLLSDSTTSFTAETVKSSVTGIIKSQEGGSVIFGNVVLSDKLEKNDIVVTKGDMDLQGNGYPPKLIVGKIVSVDKQPSNLFQSAKVQSLVNISQLGMVFVLSQ